MRTSTLTLALALALPWATAHAEDEHPEQHAEAQTTPRPPSPEARTGPSDARFERMTGQFQLAAPKEQVEQRVQQSIDRAVAEMSFFTRGMAQDRLRETNPVRERVRTQVNDRVIAVRYGDATYVTPHGEWTSVTDPQGNPVQLKQEVVGEDRIHQTFRSDDGEKLTVYRFSDDGLRLDVTVTSQRLPEPLRYQIDYRRATPSGATASR